MQVLEFSFLGIFKKDTLLWKLKKKTNAETDINLEKMKRMKAQPILH